MCQQQNTRVVVESEPQLYIHMYMHTFVKTTNSLDLEFFTFKEKGIVLSLDTCMYKWLRLRNKTTNYCLFKKLSTNMKLWMRFKHFFLNFEFFFFFDKQILSAAQYRRKSWEDIFSLFGFLEHDRLDNKSFPNAAQVL